MLWGFTEISKFQGDSQKTNKQEVLRKKGREEAWTICRFKRELGEKQGGVFERGLTPYEWKGRLFKKIKNWERKRYRKIKQKSNRQKNTSLGPSAFKHIKAHSML